MTSYLTAPLSGEAPRPFGELVEEALNALPSTFPRDITQVMVALDIDGTILSPSGASTQVVESIAALSRAGAQVVIATGRSMGAVLPVLPLLGFRRGWIVASNGAVLARVHEAGYEIVHRHEFSPAEVIDEALKTLPHARFAVEDRNLRLISTGFPEGEIVEDTKLVSVDELKAMRTPKLVIREPALDRDAFESILCALPFAETHEVFVGWTSWADISSLGVTKASGLDELRRDLSLPVEGTVAIGDGTNDIAMIQWAAFGVAMGGATEEIRVHSDFVAAAVENDGAAAVMQAILCWCAATAS